MIQFNATYLKHLLPFKAQQQDIRYYLNAVHIAPHEDGGAVLIACNGHTMMCVRDVSAVCEAATTFSVHADAARHGAKRRGSRDALASLDEKTQRLTISDGQTFEELYLQPGKCLIENTAGLADGYVDWRKVMPPFDRLLPGGADAVDVRYHELAAKAHPLGKGTARAIRFWQAGPTASLVVEFCDAQEFMLIIMPLMSHSKDPAPHAFWGKAFGKKQGPVAPEAKESNLEAA